MEKSPKEPIKPNISREDPSLKSQRSSFGQSIYFEVIAVNQKLFHVSFISFLTIKYYPQYISLTQTHTEIIYHLYKLVGLYDWMAKSTYSDRRKNQQHSHKYALEFLHFRT